MEDEGFFYQSINKFLSGERLVIMEEMDYKIFFPVSVLMSFDVGRHSLTESNSCFWIVFSLFQLNVCESYKTCIFDILVLASFGFLKLVRT